MRVLLVAPASGNWHRVGRFRFFNGRAFRFSLLSLLSIAGSGVLDHDRQLRPPGLQFRSHAHGQALAAASISASRSPTWDGAPVS